MAGRFLAGIVLAFLALAAAGAAELPPEPLVRALREARILGDQGKDDEQVKALESAAAAYPNEILPLLALLERHIEHQAPAATIAEVRTRLAARLADPATPLSLAAVRRIATDPSTRKEDLAALGTALEARATGEAVHERTLEALVVVREALGDLPAARATLDRLLAMRASTERIAAARVLAVRAQDWAAAAGYSRAMLAEKPNDPDAMYALANDLANQGDVAALEIADKLAKDPKRTTWASSIALNLAWSLRDLGRNADAETAFRKCLVWNPDNSIARAAVLNLYASDAERKAHAAALADRWAKEENPFALLTEGAQSLAAGDAGRASLLLERATTLAPDDDIAWYNLALAQIKLERWMSAEQSLRKTIALKPDRPESHLQLGRVLQKLGKCADAIAPLETSLRLRKDLKQVHFYLYECNRELGNAAEADLHLRLHKEETGAK